MRARALRRRIVAPDRRRAFTLLEIILALALILLIASAAFVAQLGWRERQEFQEGVRRFETVLRRAKVDAAMHSTRLRLAFDEEDGTPQIQWEPQPLTEPAEFSEYTANMWRDEIPVGLLRVSRCELVGPSAYRTLIMDIARGQATDGQELEAITFYPNGESDSALIELAPKDDETSLRAVIELDGLNGTITCRILTSVELEAYYEHLEEDGYFGTIGG